MMVLANPPIPGPFPHASGEKGRRQPKFLAPLSREISLGRGQKSDQQPVMSSPRASLYGFPT
jgi:hypothetical protein